MNLRFSRSILLLLALPAFAHGTKRGPNNKIKLAKENGIDNEWIIVMKTDSTQAIYEGGTRGRNRKLIKTFDSEDAQSIANSVANSVAENVQVHTVFSNAVRGFSANMSVKAAEKLAERPDVDYVEQDATMSISTTWGIDRVDQRNLPLDGAFAPAGDGTGVTAYILDTGVQTSHNEFGGRATWGINTSGDNDDRDCHGHGTHVAGTVGGSVYGVAKNVNIVAVKVLQCSGSGSTSGVIQGVEWVMNDAAGKKATANMSLGGGFSPSLNTAVKNLHNSGVPTVVAAGNDSSSACNYSPAAEPAVITVGSTTNSDARSGFSNFGSCLDIFAPGSGITAAWIGADSATNTISGTSMASPHVCGGAALLLGNNIAAADVTNLLMAHATDDKVGSPGSGSPNKLLYVGPVGPTPAPTPAPPTPAPTPCIANDFKLTITTDNYPAETTWTLVNQCTNEQHAEGGPYDSTNTQFVEEECIPNGEYTFTINDSYGDGICCGYGSGSYALEYNGNIIKQGGEFAGSESTTFGSCAAPTNAPTGATAPPVTAPTGGDWELIYEDDFETGQGLFMGTNKRFNVVSYPDGEWSLRFRKTSRLTTEWLDVPAYSQISFKFWFYADGTEAGDNFFLRVKFNGEKSYTTIDEWVSGTDFDNQEWVQGTVIIDIPEEKNAIQFQIRGDSNERNDRVYVDQVLVEGK